MILLKTPTEIEKIQEGSLILGKLFGVLSKELRPGISTLYLDEIAEKYINEFGAKPSFKGLNGYPFTLCTSVNDHIVHGLPSEYKIKNGDIISIDCGVFFEGFHSDSAFTFAVGDIDKSTSQLLEATKHSLNLVISQLKPGIRTGDIGHVIQKYIENQGYSIIRELVGHGIGKKLHEDPEFPNYGSSGTGPKLKNGMVFALEPMVSMGKRKVIFDEDGWTVRTADGTLASHFEHTIALINDQAKVLTTFEYIDKKYNP